MKKKLKLFIIVVIAIGVSNVGHAQTEYQLTDDLQVKQLSEHLYVHISILNIPNYGQFPCNGFIYVNNGEALIMDTPNYDSLSFVLIDWVNSELNAEVVGLVVNHFHIDCIGGMAAFQDRGIPTYSLQLTKKFSEEKNEITASNVFIDSLILHVGNAKVYSYSFGPGHTRDNIITWIPESKAIFGGCQVKSIGAGKGNLEDADVYEWPLTIAKIKNQFSNYEIVVPGHGATGGVELLDYTIELFSE